MINIINADYILHIPYINQLILDYLQFKDQFKITYLNKVFSILKIKNLIDCNNLYNCRVNRQITNEILLLYPFCEKINLSNCSKITNISHMKCLVYLNASMDCGIDDKGLNNLVNLQKIKCI